MDDISPFAVPDGRNAITAGWLEAVLKHNGTIGPDVQVGLPVISEMERPGLIGQVIRLHLTYDPAAAGPASLIAKFPSRTLAESLAFSCTEADFYAHHINGPATLQTPKIYYCRSDESNNRCCVLLEDLHNGRFVKQIDGGNETQARLAIRAIARLHGAWWNKPLPAALSRVRPPLSSPIGNFCSARLRSYKGAWPSLLSAIMPRFIKNCDLLRAQLSAGPRTLVHGDFHSQNIYFSDDGASLTLIDFQFVQQGSGMLDVARFLTGRPEGLLTGKKVYLAISSAGVYTDGPMKAFDFAEPYLRYILGFVGLTDVTTFRIQGLSISGVMETAVEKGLESVVI